MESMNQSSFASQEIKVYRFNWAYKLYHFGVGAAALIGAVLCRNFLFLAAVLVLFSIFMIARPLITSVTVDQYSVTFKGMFSSNSLLRSSITAVETQHTGKTPSLILWGNIDEKENLAIPDLFGFDDDWDDWWNTYRDLSDDKPLSLF
jgi:hypothetical protein